MKKKIFVFLFDGFSDWEISYVTPEIHKNENFELIYFSESGNHVTSMGGMKVNPTLPLSKLEPAEVDLLVLPGGTTWENETNDGVKKLVIQLFKNIKPIAAICAATTFLGQLGFLDNLKHTSNDLNYLKAIAPDYRGEKIYQNTLAVLDRNIITANGIAPIEFAREIFKTLELYNDSDREKWFQLFKNGIWSE